MTLTSQQLRALDRLAERDYAVPTLILMENAGRGCASAILDQFAKAGRTDAGRAAILCGGGNNGGDGFVIARHLENAGMRVDLVIAADRGRYRGDAATNFAIAQRMGIPMVEADEAEGAIAAADIVVDALLGTGSSGPPRPPISDLIRLVHRAAPPGALRVAIDIPTGLNADTGEVAEPCFRADLTLTMVAEKPGFQAEGASRVVGRVEVVEIGVPRAAIERVGQMG